MSDWTSIANMALIGLGVREVTSLADASLAARKINAVMPQCVDETLYAHPWKIAMTRALVPASATPLAWGFANAFPLPDEPYCLRPWAVEADCIWHDWGRSDRGWDLEGRNIVTDFPAPLRLKYIARVDDPALFTGPLATCLSLRVQWAIAYDRTNSKEIEEAARQAFMGFLPDTRSLDSQQGTPPPIRRSDILAARL